MQDLMRCLYLSMQDLMRWTVRWDPGANARIHIEPTSVIVPKHVTVRVRVRVGVGVRIRVRVIIIDIFTCKSET